eukprot:5754692-Prymnesium_polylepis.1
MPRAETIVAMAPALTTLVMVGEQGSGKSSLINALGQLGQRGSHLALAERGGVDSVTAKTDIVRCHFRNGDCAKLIDTPGVGSRREGGDTASISAMVRVLKEARALPLSISHLAPHSFARCDIDVTRRRFELSTPSASCSSVARTTCPASRHTTVTCYNSLRCALARACWQTSSSS